MSSPYYVSQQFSLNGKRYIIINFVGSVSAGAAFPSTPITVPYPGKMSIMILVGATSLVQMVITLPNGTTAAGYLASGNQIPANTWYTAEDIVIQPGMQIQFVVSNSTNVAMFVTITFDEV